MIKSLIDIAGPGLKPEILGIVDPSAVTKPSNGIPYQQAPISSISPPRCRTWSTA